MTDATICFVRQGDNLLLGKKKIRFGAGLWNGFGGKIEKGETPIVAAQRELKEEAGLESPLSSFKKCALIYCYFEQKKEFDHTLHVFITNTFTGEPRESDEMVPGWHAIENLPFHDMWPADREWVPLVLQEGKLIEGEIYFSGEKPPFGVNRSSFQEKTILK